MKCSREKFMDNIKQQIPQFESFSEKNIIEYCLNLHDINIQKTIAIYVKNILQIHREECEVPPLYILSTKFIDNKSIQKK